MGDGDAVEGVPENTGGLPLAEQRGVSEREDHELRAHGHEHHPAVAIAPVEPARVALDEAHAFYAAAQLTARRSNLISVASLLFSACAVALSLTLGGGSPSGAAPAQRLVAERAAPKALNPDAHYVRLEELSIYRDQIVAGAIGTAELGDASVSWPGGAPHGAAVSALPLLPTAFRRTLIPAHARPCAP